MYLHEKLSCRIVSRVGELDELDLIKVGISLDDLGDSMLNDVVAMEIALATQQRPRSSTGHDRSREALKLCPRIEREVEKFVAFKPEKLKEQLFEVKMVFQESIATGGSHESWC